MPETTARAIPGCSGKDRFEPTVRSGGVESSSTLFDVAFDVGVMLRF